MLSYYKKYIKTQDDLKNLESKLNDYDSIVNLVDIIGSVFTELTQKIDERISL